MKANMMLRRDALLASLAALGSFSCRESCGKSTGQAPEIPASALASDGGNGRGAVRLVTMQFSARAGTAESAAVTAIVPAWGAANEKFPMLVALHGRGEAQKSPLDGSMGWARDYALVRGVSRIAQPPLTAADYESFVEPSRLAQVNEELREKPFGGLVILCPHLPDVDTGDPKRIDEFSSFLFETIMPRVVNELPVSGDPKRLGIDGVSLGGAAALWTGLRAPEKFGAVGTLQPAIGEKDAPAIAEALARARQKNPSLKFRLLSSNGDYFKNAVETAGKALRERGLEHELLIVPGPHDYPFNRGPGALEMLLWHDRQLRAG